MELTEASSYPCRRGDCHTWPDADRVLCRETGSQQQIYRIPAATHGSAGPGPSPTPQVTASGGGPGDMRPFPATQGAQVLGWLSSRWGLKPGFSGRVSRSDASTKTTLGAWTLSSDREHLRLLACDATLTAFGKQMLTGCATNVLTGSDQSDAVSWLNAEFASGLPVPASGTGTASATLVPITSDSAGPTPSAVWSSPRRADSFQDRSRQTSTSDAATLRPSGGVTDGLLSARPPGRTRSRSTARPGLCRIDATGQNRRDLGDLAADGGRAGLRGD